MINEKKWPPKNYVYSFDAKSYHNDPAQQHGSIAEDKLRAETIARLKAEKAGEMKNGKKLLSCSTSKKSLLYNNNQKHLTANNT